ncbi:Venom serine protease 34 [Cyphomyrmex costatus]|uniref:Venom serine protease 34 n=1 Tax=Cyphomyrmex costatus TaxID=456900 RepID=A0A195D5K8_9HYME|nr:Venom serine protease 34 [Cyphomyrmex costatus]
MSLTPAYEQHTKAWRNANERSRAARLRSFGARAQFTTPRAAEETRATRRQPGASKRGTANFSLSLSLSLSPPSHRVHSRTCVCIYRAPATTDDDGDREDDSGALTKPLCVERERERLGERVQRNFKCTLDRLTVYVNDSLTRYYCGNEPFSIESTGTFMTIELSTPFWSSGVKFLCELQTIEEIVNNDDCCKCGWKKPTKIVGGMETGVNEYPMMAGLVDLFEKDVFCGATIISKKHVLTAAHCLIDTDPSTVNILVGDHDLTTGADTNASRLYTIAKFYMHPLYNIQPPQNDIAIVMVNSVISFNEEVGPACLPFQHQFDSFAGSNVVLLGWGLTNYSQMKSNVLQKVTVAVITNQECRKEYPTITNDHICTYTEGKDACQFDSGGPALWQNPTTKREVLVGIISGGMGCGGSNAGINTRVGAYIDWILSVTSGKCMKCTMRHVCIIVSLREHLFYEIYIFLQISITACLNKKVANKRMYKNIIYFYNLLFYILFRLTV